MGGFFCIVKIKKFFVNGGQYAPPLFSMHYERQITGVFNLPNCISQLLPSTLYLDNFIRSQDITMFEPP